MVTYFGYNKENKPEKNIYPLEQVLYYQIITQEVFDSEGKEKMEDILKSGSYFKSVERYFEYAPPEKGYYLQIKADFKPPSIKGILALYASAILLTAIPAWSNTGGFDVYYIFYVDGKKEKTFFYEIKRFIGLWIVFLPFEWINLFTESKEDAFTATTYQFINDFRVFLKTKYHATLP